MNIKEQIAQILAESAKKLGVEEVDKLVVSFSNRPELCDFQTNFAMIVCKTLGQKPIDVANQLVENVAKDSGFEFSVAMPGFINIVVKDKTLAEYAEFVSADKNCGIEQVSNPRTILFDYGGANVAKELHVGHLRSPIVGEALKRLHIAM